MEDQQTCGWLFEVRNNPQPPEGLTDEELDHWHDDIADWVCENPTLIVECGAPVHEIVDGWECEGGHRHLNYGSPSQQAEERAEAWAELHGIDHYAY